MTTPHASVSRTVPVEFTGKSGEYFKLWMVNLLLTIVTLGIYGAWAKVRNTQYMYGHTSIDGHRLRYLATPIQILKGRAIALALFMVYSALINVSVYLAIILPLIFMFVSPWLIKQGIRFSLRMTAYRNVRLSFSGTYGGALMAFLVYPLIGTVTFFLAMPWAIKKMHEYMFDNITCGGKKLDLNNSTGFYYGVILIAMGMVIAIMAALFVFFVGAGTLASGDIGDPAVMMAIMPVFFIGYFLIVYGVSGFVMANLRNHIYNNLSMDNVVSFYSTVSVPGYMMLTFTNGLLIIFTLGLAYPVTKIRKAAYLAAATEVVLEPGLEELVNTVDDESAIGEETSELFDADVSLV